MSKNNKGQKVAAKPEAHKKELKKESK